jgi:hypothetical protein
MGLYSITLVAYLYLSLFYYHLTIFSHELSLTHAPYHLSNLHDDATLIISYSSIYQSSSTSLAIKIYSYTLSFIQTHRNPTGIYRIQSKL